MKQSGVISTQQAKAQQHGNRSPRNSGSRSKQLRTRAATTARSKPAATARSAAACLFPIWMNRAAFVVVGLAIIL